MKPRIDGIRPEDARGKSKDLLESIREKFGLIPNFMRTLARAPGSLEAWMASYEALWNSTLKADLCEQIALAVSERNDCEYCVRAHAAFNRMHGRTTDEIAAIRRGESADPRTQAALRFAAGFLELKGGVSDKALSEVRAAGFDDAEILQLAGVVGITNFGNYICRLAGISIDFPPPEGEE